MTLTPDTVAQLWSLMTAAYGTTVIDKRNAPEMRLVSRFLPTPNFLERYATTIGKRIYLPFIPGEVSDRWSLVGQVAVCAHEHQHVEQLNRDGLRFLLGYITNTSRRAVYEVEAYRTTLELQWFLTGSMADPDGYADGLVNYGCRASDVETARKTLELAADSVRAGIIATRAAQRAIGFLKGLA